MNIPLPDGSVITLPAWASEATMDSIKEVLIRSNTLTSDMLKGVKELQDIDDEIINAIEDNIQATGKNTQAIIADAKKSDAVVGVAKVMNKTASFFGNSEKPMTGIVDAMKSLKDQVGGPEGKAFISKIFGKFPAVGEFFSKFGKVADVSADVALAWMGWNAAKFEQFAEVQGKMINSGSIFYDTASAFDQLYEDAFQTGVTYNAFADTVSNFGGTMTALGGDVSSGSRNFLTMFSNLTDTTEELGDLGMQTKEMMDSYAGYIEVMRLTGNINKKLGDSGEQLGTNFKKLVIESTAIANLTSLDRNKAMQAQLAAMSDTFAAAGLQELTTNGLDKQKAVAEAFVKQFGLASALFEGTPADKYIGEIQNSFNRNLAEYSNNIQDFDIRKGMDTNIMAAFERVMPEFFERINGMVRTGEMSSEQATKFILDEFSKMDLSKIAASSAQGSTIQRIIQELQTSTVRYKKNSDKFTGKSQAEIDKILAETQTKYKESGATVVAMNDMTKAFLTAQEAITLNISSLSNSIQAFSSWLSGETPENIRKLFTDPDAIPKAPGTQPGSSNSSSTPNESNPNPTSLPPTIAPYDTSRLRTLEKELTRLKDQVKMDEKLGNDELLAAKLIQIKHIEDQIKAEEDLRAQHLAKQRRNQAQ